MAQMNEHREFERHPLDLAVEVFNGSKGGVIEQTRLKNISGGGACFLSSKPEAYAPGEEIVLEMHLPVTHGEEALMQGRATVIWVGDDDEGSDQKRIGVSMIQLMSIGLKEGGPII